MPKNKNQHLKAARATLHMARELHRAAEDALAALNGAKDATEKAAALDGALESLAFLCEQSENAISQVQDGPSEDDVEYLEFMEDLCAETEWLSLPPTPLVYHDEGGAFVEAFVWIDEEDLDDEGEEGEEDDEDEE